MMQDEGLTQPADVQAQDWGKMEERMHVIGKSLVGFIHSNQLVGNQQLMDDEIELVMIPNAGDHPGQYMKPPPHNAGEIDRAQHPAWEAVAFGQSSPKDGATAWYDDAARILKR